MTEKRATTRYIDPKTPPSMPESWWEKIAAEERTLVEDFFGGVVTEQVVIQWGTEPMIETRYVKETT